MLRCIRSELFQKSFYLRIKFIQNDVSLFLACATKANPKAAFPFVDNDHVRFADT
jgi:hypothetical protein